MLIRKYNCSFHFFFKHTRKHFANTVNIGKQKKIVFLKSYIAVLFFNDFFS